MLTNDVHEVNVVSGRFLLIVLTLCVSGTVFPVWAQQRERTPVVGVLLITAGPNDPLIMGGLRQGLRDAGYVEGRSIKIEHRYARGHVEDLPKLARELVQLNVDVLVVGAEPIVRAAKQATTTIPIVMVLWDHDPVAAGLIESFNQPGGNITGIFSRTSELAPKRLELLKEAIPSLSRVAVLWDAYSERQLEGVKAAAQSLGVQLRLIEMRAPYKFDAAFKAATRDKAGAMMVMFSPVFYVERERMAASALKAHMPTMYQEESAVAAGGLVCYGPVPGEMWIRAGYFVDRLLKGAKPSQLAVEQATTYRLVINEKTAKALKLTIPQSLMLRADQIIH